MILSKKGDFEEAESVAERLYRQSIRSEKNTVKQEINKKDENPSKDDAKSSDSKKDRKITFEFELARPLGLVLKEVNGYGVFVEALTNGSALSAGVRRGDRIVATGSTIGNQMWEKHTLDGILSAVHSGIEILVADPNFVLDSWVSLLTAQLFTSYFAPLFYLLSLTHPSQQPSCETRFEFASSGTPCYPPSSASAPTTNATCRASISRPLPLPPHPSPRFLCTRLRGGDCVFLTKTFSNPYSCAFCFLREKITVLHAWSVRCLGMACEQPALAGE
jgi:hypothetical protein